MTEERWLEGTSLSREIRRRRIRSRRRKAAAPHTLMDMNIAGRMPGWLRADYLVADRIAADRMLEWLHP